MDNSQPSDVAGLRVELLGSRRVAARTRIIPDDHWKLLKAKSIVKLLTLTPDQDLHREQVVDLFSLSVGSDHSADTVKPRLYAHIMAC